MNNLTLFSQNLRSMSNFPELVTHIENNLKQFIGVLAVQETWSIKHRKTKICGFHDPYIKTRSRRDGGGVGVWVNELFTYSVLQDFEIFEEGMIETQAIQLVEKNGK